MHTEARWFPRLPAGVDPWPMPNVALAAQSHVEVASCNAPTSAWGAMGKSQEVVSRSRGVAGATLEAMPTASRAEEVYRQIKQAISGFELMPGDRFSESDWCARMGVSRTPVRQALHQLRQEGYVEVLPRSGWRIRPLDFDLYEQLYELRLLLEQHAVQRLCDAQESGLGGLRGRTLEGLRERWSVPAAQRMTDTGLLGRWDEEFHTTLVESAGNAEMAKVHREVCERLRVLQRLELDTDERIHGAYDDHARLLQLIALGDSDAALALLRQHIGQARSEVRRSALQKLQLARQMQPGLAA